MKIISVLFWIKCLNENDMDKIFIKRFNHLQEQKYTSYSNNEIFQLLQYSEWLCQNRREKEGTLPVAIKFSCAMKIVKRSTGFKQLKHYFLQEIGMVSKEARLKFTIVLTWSLIMFLKFLNMDIRDLPLNGLALTHNTEWVQRWDALQMQNKSLLPICVHQ